MATKISGRSILALRNKFQGLAKRTDGLKKKGEQTVEKLVASAEVSASAFAFGAVQGRYGQVDLLGVPADLAAALALHLAGFTGMAGKSSEHLHNFADGALASFFFTMGKGTGVNWKAKGLGPKTAVKGDELTDADLAALTGSGSRAA